MNYGQIGRNKIFAFPLNPGYNEASDKEKIFYYHPHLLCK